MVKIAEAIYTSHTESFPKKSIWWPADILSAARHWHINYFLYSLTTKCVYGCVANLVMRSCEVAVNVFKWGNWKLFIPNIFNSLTAKTSPQLTFLETWNFISWNSSRSNPKFKIGSHVYAWNFGKLTSSKWHFCFLNMNVKLLPFILDVFHSD